MSASQFTTGFVGQTAAQTRDIFDSARGAVLFIDEAYRLYDPMGRSYMQARNSAQFCATLRNSSDLPSS